MTSNLVPLIIEAERTLAEGLDKKNWVLSKLPQDVDKDDASIIIDDMISLLNSKESILLFNHSRTLCLKWCCRKFK
jgi:hypothetical protein